MKEMDITDTQNSNPCPTPPKQKKRLKTHLKANFDPSKPLKHPKHEIMARKIAGGATQIEAYKSVYPNTKDESINAVAYRTVAQQGINERALKLLESVGLSEKKLASKLNECVDSETETIKLDATKTGFKLLGYGSEQKLAESSYSPTQINIIIRSNSTQPIDITPVNDDTV